MDDKLKLCAHCGGRAEMGRNFGRIGIACTKCGINIRSELICGETGYDGIVEAWNKRAKIDKDDLLERANLAEAALVKFEQLAAEEYAGIEAQRNDLLAACKESWELLQEVASMNIQPFPIRAVALNNQLRRAIEKAK